MQDVVPVIHTSSPELVTKYQPARVVLLRQFEPKVVPYGQDGLEAAALARWVVSQSMPLTVPFTRSYQQKIFSDSAPTKHVLALHAAGYANKPAMESLQDVAAKHQGDVLFITVEENGENSGVF